MLAGLYKDILEKPLQLNHWWVHIICSNIFVFSTRNPKGVQLRDRKKRPRVDFFGSTNFAELTNLHNQARV